jgi:conjugative relaxase-like TrwC/TraI family protein
MEGAMMTRVAGKRRDEDRVTSNMVWAGFTHRTTRPVTDDGISFPIRSSICMPSSSMRPTTPEENKWKAAEFSNLVRDKGYYQAAFHSRLAGKRLSDLGYGIERDGNSFRLAGIDKSTADKFSRRSDQIEAEAGTPRHHDAKTKGEPGPDGRANQRRWLR